MKVLVDTSVWSLAFRRKETGDIARKLTELILSSLVVMIGPVRQELLSGISDEEAFVKLKDKLQAYAVKEPGHVFHKTNLFRPR